jgi:hypothetical protein
MIHLVMANLNDLPPGNEEIGNLTVLREYTDLAEAAIARSVLESAGIRCVLGGDKNFMALGRAASAFGGFKLCVSPQDAAMAAEILDQEIQESFDVVGVGQYKQPRCPKCQSLNISLRDWDKRSAGLLLGIPGPIGLSGRSWLCHSCEHEWPDSDDFPEQDKRSET